MIYMFLADGFEEIEAIATLDILRRAKIEIATVGVTSLEITAAHGVKVKADKSFDQISFKDCTGVILPGGMPGTINLENSKTVLNYVKYAAESSLLVAAICAAPSILGHMGLLNGKKAVCYPGYETDLTGAAISDSGAVCDGNFITGKGAGAAMDFGFAIVEKLKSRNFANELRASMQCNQ